MKHPNRNIPLDGFRGLLALVVACGHFFHVGGFPEKFPTSFVVAVDFFFVLSGYVLTKSIMESKKTGEQWFNDFFMKRIIRIYPLYFVSALLGSLLFVYFRKIDLILDFKTFFYFLSLGQMVFFAPENNLFLDNLTTLSIAWSISTELWGGILFFSLVFMLRNYRYVMVLLSAIFAVLFLLFIEKHGVYQMNIHYYRADYIHFGLYRGFLGFGLGYIAYYMRNYIGSIKVPTLLQLGILLLIFMLYGSVASDLNNQYLAPFMSLLLVFFFLYKEGYVYKAMDNICFEWFGKLSYGIYLTHPIVMEIFNYYEVIARYRYLPIFISLTLLLAYVLHVGVENFCIKVYQKKKSHKLK